MTPWSKVEFSEGPRLGADIRRNGLGSLGAVREAIASQVTASPLRRDDWGLGLTVYEIELLFKGRERRFEVLCAAPRVAHKKAILAIKAVDEGGFSGEEKEYFLAVFKSARGGKRG